MQIICPLCQQALQTTDKVWHCENRHSFDIAKQGYANLLPVQNKKSKSPGDDAWMVAARKAFLGDGHYLPLAQNITQLVIEHLKGNDINKPAIIDAGCGEGYYTSFIGNALQQQAKAYQLIGTDISKHAIVAAAKQDKNTQWFVANSNALPVADHNADIIVSLFAPTQSTEFHRCLQHDGLLIVATTGKKHLIELRELLYPQVNEKTFDPATALNHHFMPTSQVAVDFNLELQDNPSIKNLLAMTPHYWRASPERKALLDDIVQLSLSVNIHLHSFKPR